MMIRGTTRLLGILGHPLSHSYSPAMHNAAIEQMGLDLAYLPLSVEEADLGVCLRAMQALKFLGANVTMPHKRAVIPFLDELSDLSRLMGAVNTLVFREGKIFGTTTDPEGFLAGFREAGHSFDGQSVAILGNGGSARTIAFALFHLAKPRRVTVVARAPEKSHALAEEIAAKLGQNLNIVDLQQYFDRRKDFDIIVHTTPVGMHPRVEETLIPSEWLEPGQIIYDIVNNPEETALLRQAQARGCRTVGGLGMLVHQGVASFKLWTGQTPDPAHYYSGIRRQQALGART